MCFQGSFLHFRPVIGFDSMHDIVRFILGKRDQMGQSALGMKCRYCSAIFEDRFSGEKAYQGYRLDPRNLTGYAAGAESRVPCPVAREYFSGRKRGGFHGVHNCEARPHGYRLLRPARQRDLYRIEGVSVIARESIRTALRARR